MKKRERIVPKPGTGSKPRLLVIGDAVAPTGYATVTRNLCRHLKESFEICQLGVNYFGDPHSEAWKIYPACLGGDPHGVRRVKTMVETLRPDLVLAVNDPWILGDYMDQLRSSSRKPRVAMYCPVDAAPLEPFLVERLEGIDRFIVYTRYGKAAVESALADVKRSRPDFGFPPIDVLPHGVDCGTFHPLDASHPRVRRQRALRKLFPDRPELEGSFVVLNANRNQPRKRIDITIKGFSLFARNKPDHVKLYLHMGIQDCGWHVRQLAERHGIQDRLLLSTDQDALPAVPAAMLNTIYNAATVGLNTSCGEGWGLVSFEHAATGAAQVVPRHSACEELWEGSALLVDPVMSLTMERVLSEAKIISPEGVADSLENLYAYPDLLEDLSAAAYRNATRPEYRWSKIAARWARLLFETLEGATSQESERDLVHAA